MRQRNGRARESKGCTREGMKIGYRRFSGKIGLSDQETGSRGSWIEKRRSLLKHLESRGHEVSFLSDPTEASKGLFVKQDPTGIDFLFLEFSGMNSLFFGEHIVETWRICSEHDGRVFFLCDDPDLVPDFKKHGNIDEDRIVMLTNAYITRDPKFYQENHLFGVGDRVTVMDFPFASLLNPKPPIDQYSNEVVYIGRPNGRTGQIRRYKLGKAVAIYGKQNEWDGTPVTGPAPPQTERSVFYSSKKACFCAYDKKHQATNWRTGRAYHALYAGTPAIAPSGNLGLKPFAQVTSYAQLESIAAELTNPKRRKKVWEEQYETATMDIVIANKTLERIGL